MFPIPQTEHRAEASDDLHQGRILLLLLWCRTAGAVDGIMKLAKLDFLLRYPVYFTRLLAKTRKCPPTVPAEAFERDTVESSMIRFRYGPWDPRYRRWIGLLTARHLVDARLEGRTVKVVLTHEGEATAIRLSQAPSFQVFSHRAQVLGDTLAKVNGTKLKNLIYEHVPEVTGTDWGEEIPV